MFDSNPAIVTNTWLNTIDKQKPSSNVLPLPAILSDTTFYIGLQGTDPHSGIQDYDVYVTVNDTATYLLLNNYAFDSAGVKGQYGSTYKFYSIARDRVGNIEDAPAQPDAVVTLQQPVDIASVEDDDVSIVPNPTNHRIQISGTALKGVGQITLSDMWGRIVLQTEQSTIDLSSLQAGTYFIIIGTHIKRIVKL
ncbi:MAG: T9SS type A sorting domain-containing protein [Bacteroidetes bacterium]|nr:T9SS type A sorting domain-containing protein [Bacteroidota bacterium]